MADHPNVAVVKQYLAAAGRGDMAAAASCFAPGLRYNVAGRNQLAGRFTGQTAALDYFGKIMQLTNGTYGIDEQLDWLASDQRALLIAREHADRDGSRYVWTRLVLFVIADSKIAQVDLFEDDQYAFDAFLS